MTAEPARACPCGGRQVAQRFVTRGNFVVMPLAFPSVTAPIDADDSLVTALALHSDGLRVVGGTSGSRAHLFEAAPKAAGGYVYDMGAVEGATETVRVEALDDRALACVNGPGGGRIVLQWVHGQLDGIQEWARIRTRAETLTELPGERILDGRVDPGGEWVLVMTDRRLVRVALAGPATKRARAERPAAVEPRMPETLEGGEVRAPAIGRISVASDGRVLATLVGPSLVSVDVAAARVEETGAGLPFAGPGWGWAATPDGRLVAAAADGRLFAVDAVDPRAGRTEELGRTLVAPVKCMACLPDGKAYGLSGDGIGRFFELDVARRTVDDLGAVVGVLGAKRYANTFACAVAGPDGEIYLGEDDRGGHLWIYFPPRA